MSGIKSVDFTSFDYNIFYDRNYELWFYNIPKNFIYFGKSADSHRRILRNIHIFNSARYLPT